MTHELSGRHQKVRKLPGFLCSPHALCRDTSDDSTSIEHSQRRPPELADARQTLPSAIALPNRVVLAAITHNAWVCEVLHCFFVHRASSLPAVVHWGYDRGIPYTKDKRETLKETYRSR